MSDQTPENGQAEKKSPPPPKRLGLLAVLALAITGILFAILPSGEVKAQSNSPTNRFSQTPRPSVFGHGGWDAIDCNDCDTYYYYNKRNAEPERYLDNAIDAAKAKYTAERADAYSDYRDAFQPENASFNGDIVQSDADFFASH